MHQLVSIRYPKVFIKFSIGSTVFDRILQRKKGRILVVFWSEVRYLREHMSLTDEEKKFAHIIGKPVRCSPCSEYSKRNVKHRKFVKTYVLLALCAGNIQNDFSTRCRFASENNAIEIWTKTSGSIRIILPIQTLKFAKTVTVDSVRFNISVFPVNSAAVHRKAMYFTYCVFLVYSKIFHHRNITDGISSCGRKTLLKLVRHSYDTRTFEVNTFGGNIVRRPKYCSHTTRQVLIFA